MKTFLVIGLVLCSSVYWASSTNTMMTSATLSDQQQDEEQIRAAARQAFMRGKLASNQKIVEGLTTKNYEMIADGANAVKALVKGQHWFVLDTPEYKRFSKDMELAATQLHDAAVDKNMDAAALRYFDLTLNCLDCHRYIETRKY